MLKPEPNHSHNPAVALTMKSHFIVKKPPALMGTWVMVPTSRVNFRFWFPPWQGKPVHRYKHTHTVFSWLCCLYVLRPIKGSFCRISNVSEMLKSDGSSPPPDARESSVTLFCGRLNKLTRCWGQCEVRRKILAIWMKTRIWAESVDQSVSVWEGEPAHHTSDLYSQVRSS